MANVLISEKEVAEFSAKFDSWGKSLSPNESALLHVLLRAAEAGMTSGTPLADEQLQRVAGGAREAARQLDSGPLIRRLFSFGGFKGLISSVEGGNAGPR